ncbi:MAG: hypothetical protein DDT19_01098 [Syntrophomonadaceae bacterium]|nr:hypothetical protein [Bacillota bacterium]
MEIGQHIKIKRKRLWTGGPNILTGEVVCISKFFVVVRTKSGYTEAVLLADIVSGSAKVVG